MQPRYCGRMHFDVIQSVSLAGNAALPNDDRFGAGDRLAWVIDGATDLGDPGLVGARGGAAWLATEADAAFAAAPDAPIDAVCRHVFARLAERFAAARTRDPIGRWEMPLGAFLAARVADDAIECAWLGDCVALLLRSGRVYRMGDVPERRADETAHAACLARQGLAEYPWSEPILESLRASRGRAGVPLLGVEPEAAGQLQLARFACGRGDELLLMSDGFAALVDAYDAFGDAGLMGALVDQGLAGLAQQLRAIEAADGDCTRYPRFKRSDDATALWLRIG